MINIIEHGAKVNVNKFKKRRQRRIEDYDDNTIYPLTKLFTRKKNRRLKGEFGEVTVRIRMAVLINMNQTLIFIGYVLYIFSND